MNDTVYRNASISEENLFPDRHPAGNKFDEWSDAMDEAGKMKKIKVGSEEERQKRISELEEIIKEDIENTPE